MADSTRNPTAGGAPAPPSRPSPVVEAEDQEPNHSVPAGEPEAPVGPAPPESEVSPPESEVPSPEQDEHAAEHHAAKLEHDLDELTARAEKADEYLGLAQRTKADFENYRKRAAREAGAAQERGVIKLTKELLPAVDNLDRALDAADGSNSADDLLAGIKLVHADVLAALARVGVERFDPAGEPFDPTCHEAMAQQPVEGAETGTVVEVYQRGYRLGDTVIRPARVVVAG
ncbi:MAG: nucleotide exchange factor GrpE [Solirubrobacteraceae bacterium]